MAIEHGLLFALLIALVMGALQHYLYKARSTAKQTVDKHELLQMQDKLDALLKKAGAQYDPDGNLPMEIREAIRNDRKIEAIKLYRRFSGAGLKEAKDFIEGIIEPVPQIQRKLDALLKSAGVQYDPYANVPVSVRDALRNASVPAAVLDDIRNGRMIEAIKEYRTASGVGLKEAKDFVEGIKRQMGQ